MRDLDLDDLLLLAAEASNREPQEWHDAVKYEVPVLVAKVRELQAEVERAAAEARERALRDVAQLIRHWLTETGLAHEVEERVGDAMVERIRALMKGGGR